MAAMAMDPGDDLENRPRSDSTIKARIHDRHDRHVYQYYEL